MNIDDEKLDFTTIIKELEEIEYETLAQKAEAQFDTYYKTFLNNFGKDDKGNVVDNETKKDMAMATYNICIQALNNGLNYLEYAYTLSLAMQKASKDYKLEYNSIKLEIMTITNKFIYEMVNNITLGMNDEIIELLKKLNEMENI